MRYRRASSIVLRIVKNEIQCYNFLQRRGKSLSEDEFLFIKEMNNWVEEADFLCAFKELPVQQIAGKIFALSELGIIIKENSPAEKEDSCYQENWKWGESAGLYHFSIKNNKFISERKQEESFARSLVEKTKETPSPSVFNENENKYATVHTYEKPDFDKGIFKVMKRRRTIRSFNAAEPLTQNELMQSLFAGLGIVTFRNVYPIGLLPLKMTPSGGARNPYDAYIYCQNVTGLEKGMYHYSPTEHSLGLVNNKNLPAPGDMLGSQPWINNAPAVIFLVANISRTMWKYEHHGAYRVMLIEAGHIAQNIILAANELGFYGSPTAAVYDNIVGDTLNGELSLLHSCVYAIALGHLGENKNLYEQ
jgi:SagB-type dehydrogenase family enzyme